MFEIFSRIAGAGHCVVWICCNVPLLPPFRKRLPTVERIAGMLVTHLGSPLMYRLLAPLFFRRFARSFEKSGGFDVSIDCVQGRPSPLLSEIQTPVLPLVFSLASSLRAVGDMPGPVIAATTHAERDLREAGTPDAQLVVALYENDADSAPVLADPPTEGVPDDAAARSWDQLAVKVLETIEVI